jgi:hypothetical protein
MWECSSGVDADGSPSDTVSDVWLVKSATDSGSEDMKSTESTGRLSHACGLESELEDEAHLVALVSSSDDASVKLDETLDSSSYQSQQETGR